MTKVVKSFAKCEIQTMYSQNG